MDGSLTLLALVIGVCLVVLVWAGRKRFPLRIGVGNFFRRKTQVAIVVAGLLIGTAIITSSFVIQSTFDSTIQSAVFRILDVVDETIFNPSLSGSRLPFSVEVYDDLQANLSLMPNVKGLAPRYHLFGAAVDQTTQLFDPTVQIVGFDFTQDLGTFVRADGTAWDGSGLAPKDAIINERLARGVEAKVGDPLFVNLAGPSGPVNLIVNVHTIVKDEAKGAWNDGRDIFLRLDELQSALGGPGTINVIIVANQGGVKEGYLHSDQVVSELSQFLPASPKLTISKVKADLIDSASQDVDRLSQVFVLLSFFTIVAGVLLIVNIFVMLAEERKGEMGVARALGMRRTNLVQSFV